MRIDKKVLQALVVLCLIVVMYALGNMQVAAAQEEKRLAAEQAAAEQLAKERAAEAWKELKAEYPDLHMGCATTVGDVVAMAARFEFPVPTVEETVDEQGVVVQTIGAVYNSEADPPLVAVDPGHLGLTVEKYKNTGAVSVLGTVEHEWSIKIARVLKDELVARGYDVFMVRDTDEWDEYPYNNGERTVAANNMDCDILVAIHWDSFSLPEVDGYHAIYTGSSKTANYRLAKAVSDAYGEAVEGGVSKFSEPVSRKDLWQLNVAEMPAIILECGYSSNESDATWLENEENFGTIAAGIADGIDMYFIGERMN